MTQPTNKFKWDDNALIPESIEINYPTAFDEAGVPTKTETVIHFELTRPDLVKFIAEAIDTNFIIEKDIVIDGETQKKAERVPFKEVEESQRKALFDGLAKTTRGKKDSKFFEKLAIGVRGMDALIEMFFALNHVQEVTATAGNWLMLPTVRQAFTEAEMEKAQNSDSQKPTLEA